MCCVLACRKSRSMDDVDWEERKREERERFTRKDRKNTQRAEKRGARLSFHFLLLLLQVMMFSMVSPSSPLPFFSLLARDAGLSSHYTSVEAKLHHISCVKFIRSSLATIACCPPPPLTLAFFFPISPHPHPHLHAYGLSLSHCV